MDCMRIAYGLHADCMRIACGLHAGFFQTVFYFGYMGMFCLGLGLMCGTLGYSGCSIFVRRIYQNIKSD